MVRQLFFDKYGNVVRRDDSKAYIRQCGYVVVKCKKRVVCMYDMVSGLYSFPQDEDVALDVEPTVQFSIYSLILENSALIKERQKYRVFEVEDANLKNTPLLWCDIEDILVGRIQLDFTQIRGFKNLLVRVK